MKIDKTLLGLFALCFITYSQGLLPDTLWVKVTFYDFHADGSNPNFESCNCGRKTGMVQDTLSIYRKPVLLADLCCNDRIAEWYSPSGAPGSTFAFDPLTGFWAWSDLTQYKGRTGEWVGSQYDSLYDMANIVIYDSLPFTIFDAATGTYEFVRNKNLNDHEQFFWLDGRGFGEEPLGKGHNYAFSMELHHEFTYHGGEFFTFYGEDDAWVFINGQMVLDLGGMQTEVHGSINLDAAAASLNMEIGKKYMLDFFYTERRTSQSNAVITTNILTPSKPNNLITFTDSTSSVSNDSFPGLRDTVINAGDCLELFAYVVDDTGAVRHDWSRNIIWEVQDSLGNPLNVITRSESNEFCLTEAFGCVTIFLTYQDSLFPDVILFDTVQVCVEPGPPDHLVIESSPDSTVSLRDDNPLNTLYLSSTESEGSVYAVLRDKFGNFAGNATDAQWRSFDTSIVLSRSGENSIGEGIVTRRTNEGTTSVEAVWGSFKDTLEVVLQNIAYSALRIVSGTTTLRDIDTLLIRSDQDTTLMALGLRSDNGQWDNVHVRWSAAGVILEPVAPNWDYQWVKLSPLQADTGKIIISRTGVSGTIADTVVVIASNGLPKTLVLYPSEGAPDPDNSPYPSPSITINVTAGQKFPATAKIFDSRGNWLQSMEVFSAPISWRIIELEGNPPTGELSSDVGATVSFYPRRAYNRLLLVAEYRGTSTLLSDSVRLSVRPGDVDHLVIEGTSDKNVSPNKDNPLQELVFTSTDTYLSAYAVLRDSLGNFVSFSQRTSWISIDTSIASVVSGNSLFGEGIVFREIIMGQTSVVARNGDDTTLVDTLRVVLSSVTYDSLRIVVNYNGLRDITTLDIRSGEDTLLYALGLRSDTRQWDNIRIAWSSPGLVSSILAPQSAESWNFSPTVPGEGLVIIANTSASDTVWVRVADASPSKLDLYPLTGAPAGNNLPYVSPPVLDTISAGDSVPLVAKLFSVDNTWLEEYEKDSTPIQWNVVRISGGTQSPGVLKNKTGAFNSFFPVLAYTTIDIIATYVLDTKVMADTVRFYIKPASAHHLVIESSPEWRVSPNADNPIDTVFFGFTDSVESVYAVLRDIFGNFVMFSSDAAWTSGDTTVALASKGITSLGEGRLIRRAPLGVTSITAYDKAGRIDSTVVRLTSVQYDSLRIINIDGNPVSHLMMETTKDTTLFVQGKRMDNGIWEYVRADWFITGSLSVSPGPPSRSEAWSFSPADTGSGFIVTTLGIGTRQISDTVIVKFIPGLPFTLVLYPKSGQPGFGNNPYPNVGTPVVVQAGSYLIIVAKLFDQNNVWLGGYERQDQPFTWRVIEQSGYVGSGSLSDTTGFSTIYSPEKAYRSVLIMAEFLSGTHKLTDTIEVSIVPGPAHHLVIEANQNREISPNSDNPLDSIILTSQDTYRRVYAIIRDKFGNWIDYSRITDWNSSDTNIAIIHDGISGVGEGIIERANTGSARVNARNVETQYGSTILKDSVEVIVKNFYYSQLRILNSDRIEIDTLIMSTNQDTTLIVQGRRSDDSTWEDIQAQWEIDPSLEENIAPPQLANKWTFSPVFPESGWIRVTLGIDSIAMPDTVSVIFTRGEPLSVRFELLTPPESRIAGDTIIGLVRIYNNDGLVPGYYCFSGDSGTGGALYYDSLTNSYRPFPELFIDEESSELSGSSDESYMLDQCFLNGVDTVRFVLYYAPYAKDSLHEITVELGQLTASSGTFNLLPAALDSLVIEANGKIADDTLTLYYPQDGVILTSAGFDRFGNRRGLEPSNWTPDNTLHPIDRALNVTRIYYESSGAVEPEKGYIFARAGDSSSGVHSDRVYVIITGAMIKLNSAITDDSDGNGYLDRIILTFSRPVSILDSIAGLRIILGDMEFSVDSISSESEIDSVWIITMYQDSSLGEPQTSWQPYISFDAFEGVGGVQDFMTRDGAGPVVWSVVKTVESMENRTKDRVVIRFSEPVMDVSGSSLNVTTPPESLFSVWILNEKGDFLRVDALSGINNLQAVEQNGVAFYMLNGFDLSSNYFVNINTDTAKITDQVAMGNGAELENRRVRVQVKNKVPEEVTSFPNPSSPTFSRVKPGVLMANHEIRARQWVIEDNAGTVMSFKITTPDEGKVGVIVKIHDMVGNFVTSAKNYDLVRNLPKGLTAYDIDFYWNGSNERGMKVAPGVYRVIVYVDYTSSKYKDFKLIGTAGIGK